MSIFKISASDFVCKGYIHQNVGFTTQSGASGPLITCVVRSEGLLNILHKKMVPDVIAIPTFESIFYFFHQEWTYLQIQFDKVYISVYQSNVRFRVNPGKENMARCSGV